MNVNLLAVSIGNSRIHLGQFLDGKLQQSAAIENEHLSALAGILERLVAPLRGLRDARAVLASVNPPLTGRVLAALQKAWDTPVLRVEKDLPIPIGRQVDATATVGEDRLLNAAAAYGVLKQACVVVDAGTAITVDYVDGAGTFHGGAIGPGAQLMLNSLHQRAAHLPQLDFAPPQEPIGHNTAEAMRTAVYHGLRGMVRELAEKYAEVTGSYAMVVATGGDAQVLFEGYELVERIVPDLTLQGLALTLQSFLDGQGEGADESP